MKYLSLPRDDEAVRAQFHENGDECVFAKAPMVVVFPARFLERNMAFIGDDVRTVGQMMIATENAWSLFSVCAFVSLQPDAIEYFNYAGTDYVELKFEPGSKLFTTPFILQQDIVVYYMYKEFLSNGNIPFYMQISDEKDDTAAVLDTALEYAGTTIGSQREITELIASLSPRDPENLTRYFRQLSPEDQAKVKPNYIGMISAAYGATNTMSRTAGAFFDQGLIASMIFPNETVTKQERRVRE